MTRHLPRWQIERVQLTPFGDRLVRGIIWVCVIALLAIALVGIGLRAADAAPVPDIPPITIAVSAQQVTTAPPAAPAPAPAVLTSLALYQTILRVTGDPAWSWWAVHCWIPESYSGIRGGYVVAAQNVNDDGSRDSAIPQINDVWITEGGWDPARGMRDPDYAVAFAYDPVYARQPTAWRHCGPVQR